MHMCKLRTPVRDGEGGGRGGGARDKVIECCYIITAGFVGLLFDCV